MSVRNCEKCCIFKAKLQIPLMEPILCTELLDLVHIDYVSMEVTVGMKEKSTSNTQKNDSQDGPQQKSQMALAFRAYTDCLQCNKVTDNRLLTLLPHVRASTKITSRPSIPDC